MSGVLRKIEGEFPERVETGPVQFGGDWPGVFIRGDHALYTAHVLAQVARRLSPLIDEFGEMGAIEGLIKTLNSCDMRAPHKKGEGREEL